MSDIDSHPATTALFIAAALRGYRLNLSSDEKLYRLVQVSNGVERVVADRATFREVAGLCGATRKVTLRQAAERDGLAWPSSPEAFIALIKEI